jgi:hypothetical protein
MDKKNPASFHDGCDQYNATFAVVHTAGAGKGICGDCIQPPGSRYCIRSCSTDGTQCDTETSGGGEPCGTANLGETFGGFADASWHPYVFSQPYQGTKDCFLYRLGKKPERFGPSARELNATAHKYMYTRGGGWPVWLDWATIRFRVFRPSSFNTALQLVLRPHFLVHFV